MEGKALLFSFFFLLDSFEIDTHETYDPHIHFFVICDDTMHPTLPVNEIKLPALTSVSSAQTQLFLASSFGNFTPVFSSCLIELILNYLHNYFHIALQTKSDVIKVLS